MVMDSTSVKDLTFNNIFIAGIPEKRFDIRIIKGRFSSITESVVLQDSPCEDLWISPGVTDLHSHLGWTDFHQADQLKRDAGEIEVLQAQAFDATLRAGVTTVRDAGGLLPKTAQHIRQHYGQPLRVITCGDMLGANDAKGTEHLEQRVRELIHSGSSWIKIFATGGLGAPSENVLEPIFSRDELFCIVRTAHEHKKKVMVHAWGGPALDWSIDAGVDTVEHGIFLTQTQAHRLAQLGIPLIPTAAIYRIAADASGALALDKEIRERAARAAEAHPKAVNMAKREGVKIALGTDFATPVLHGRNLEEIDTLVDCGLTRKEAWQSATEVGAEILGYGDQRGRIEVGYTADAIIFNADPYKAQNASALRQSIVSVILGEGQ
jgi:imidazolonepropionase-like amidohydrolase